MPLRIPINQWQTPPDPSVQYAPPPGSPYEPVANQGMPYRPPAPAASNPFMPAHNVGAGASPVPAGASAGGARGGFSWDRVLQNPLFWGSLGLLLQGPSYQPINPLESAAKGLAMGAGWMKSRRQSETAKRAGELAESREARAVRGETRGVEAARLSTAARARLAEHYRSIGEPEKAAMVDAGVSIPALGAPVKVERPDGTVGYMRPGAAIEQGAEAYTAPGIGEQIAAGLSKSQKLIEMRAQAKELEAEAQADKARGEFDQLVTDIEAIVAEGGMMGLEPGVKHRGELLREELAQKLARAREPTGKLTDVDIELAKKQLPELWGPYDQFVLDGKLKQLRQQYGRGRSAAAPVTKSITSKGKGKEPPAGFVKD